MAIVNLAGMVEVLGVPDDLGSSAVFLGSTASASTVESAGERIALIYAYLLVI